MAARRGVAWCSISGRPALSRFSRRGPNGARRRRRMAQHRRSSHSQHERAGGGFGPGPVVDPADPRHLFWGTGESTDARPDLAGRHLRSPAGGCCLDHVHPGNGALLYRDAARLGARSNIYRSVDGGLHWSGFETRIDGQVIRDVQVIAGHRLLAITDREIYVRTLPPGVDPPTIADAPILTFATGTTVGLHVPAVASWRGTDFGSGVAAYGLQHRLGVTGDWSDVPLSPVTDSSRPVLLARGLSPDVPGRATDGYGNTSAFRPGRRVFVGLREDTALEFGTRWSLGRSASWLGGSRTTPRGPARRSPTRSPGRTLPGWARPVRRKGRRPCTSTVSRRGRCRPTARRSHHAVSSSATTSTSPASTRCGSSSPRTAGHPRVDVDAFVTLQ